MGRDVISLRDIDEQSGKHPLKSFKAFIWDRADQQPAGEHRRGGDKPPQDGSKVNDKQEPDAGHDPTAIAKALGISCISVHRATPNSGAEDDPPPHFFEGSYSAEARRI